MVLGMGHGPYPSGSGGGSNHWIILNEHTRCSRFQTPWIIKKKSIQVCECPFFPCIPIDYLRTKFPSSSLSSSLFFFLWNSKPNMHLQGNKKLMPYILHAPPYIWMNEWSVHNAHRGEGTIYYYIVVTAHNVITWFDCVHRIVHSTCRGRPPARRDARETTVARSVGR